jgi:hypothetical protein
MSDWYQINIHMVEDHAIRTNEDTKETIIKEGQTIQWPTEKGQDDKQRSTKHYTETYSNINLSNETGVISGVPEEWVTPVVLLLNDTIMLGNSISKWKQVI